MRADTISITYMPPWGFRFKKPRHGVTPHFSPGVMRIQVLYEITTLWNFQINLLLTRDSWYERKRGSSTPKPQTSRDFYRVEIVSVVGGEG